MPTRTRLDDTGHHLHHVGELGGVVFGVARVDEHLPLGRDVHLRALAVVRVMRMGPPAPFWVPFVGIEVEKHLAAQGGTQARRTAESKHPVQPRSASCKRGEQGTPDMEGFVFSPAPAPRRTCTRS
jgi:hypothetical protein